MELTKKKEEYAETVPRREYDTLEARHSDLTKQLEAVRSDLCSEREALKKLLGEKVKSSPFSKGFNACILDHLYKANDAAVAVASNSLQQRLQRHSY